MVEPLYQAARPLIASHVRRLQDARSLADMFETQRALLVEFGARQKLADTLVADQRRLRAEIKSIVGDRDRPQIVEKQRLLESVKRQQRVIRGLQHALRTIADGLAWKALRYDRLAFAVFGRGRRVGRLAEGVGFQTELNAIESFWDRGMLAIHNDLTNVLRHGDLTVIHWPRSGELQLDVVEVKAGKADPNSAQLRRISDAIEFMQKGEHPTLAEGEELRAVRLPQRSHLSVESS